MAKHNIIGKDGEKLALTYLEKENYTIIETNWRYKHLEIDIITIKESVLCFIEVKTRSSSNYGEPYLALTKSKQKNILLAANHYIEKNQIDLEIRFDLITITVNKNPPLVHYKSIFEPFQF